MQQQHHLLNLRVFVVLATLHFAEQQQQHFIHISITGFVKLIE